MSIEDNIKKDAKLVEFMKKHKITNI